LRHLALRVDFCAISLSYTLKLFLKIGKVLQCSHDKIPRENLKHCDHIKDRKRESNMGNQKDRQFHLPKNIRQMGKLGDTCQIYVEDFVYTYVHRTLHEEVKENEIPAAVLLGKTYRRGSQEYIFISGAQQVDFSFAGESTVYAESFKTEQENGADLTQDERSHQVDTTIVPDIDIVEQPSAAVASQDRQQLFWERVYQGIKEYFSDYELLGWYFSLEGSNLEVTTSMQQFFDATQEHGSRFLYYEDKLNRMDAFFIQAQGALQRLEDYAVYYEKNPSMQEFLVAQNRHTEPLRTETEQQEQETADVAQNYRAILNKLNERPVRKKHQPFVYVAGVAVLAVVAATGISQIGNYQNLKVLENTLQTVSGNVQKADTKNAQDKQTGNADTQESDAQTQNSDAQAQEQNQNAQSADNQTADGQSESTQTQTGDQNPDQASQSQTVQDKGIQEQSAQNQGDASQSQSGQNDGQMDQSQKDAGQSKEEQNNSGQAQSVNTDAQTSGRYYTVKKGDSLMSISKAVYHTTQKVQDICNANQIENMDMIYEGQRLLLP